MSEDHRAWFGWKGPLSPSSSNPSHGRDTSHYARVLQSLSSLALSTYRDLFHLFFTLHKQQPGKVKWFLVGWCGALSGGGLPKRPHELFRLTKTCRNWDMKWEVTCLWHHKWLSGVISHQCSSNYFDDLDISDLILYLLAGKDHNYRACLF